MAHRILIRRIHTERRTPTPANTTLAGENTCQINMSVQIHVMRHTRPTPSPRVAERAKERSLLDLATVSIDHHYFGTDLAPGIAAEGWREWHWECCKVGAWLREDVQVGRFLCASCMRPKRY
jgi:hypothetical protein